MTKPSDDQPAVGIRSLNGAWTLIRPQTGDSWPAVIPGCVHSDLRRASVIPSLNWRDNEATQQWIDGESWVYRRNFRLNESELEAENIELICDGLDTLATVTINGKSVLQADNMYRVWSRDVRSLLHPGENLIEIVFASTLARIAEGQAKRPLREWNIYFDRHLGRGHVRKMPCSYGWDWGPVAPTAGIWKDIRLEFIRGSRWKDLRIRQQHSPGLARLGFDWKITGPGSVRIELWREGSLLAEAAASAEDGTAALEVSSPLLWWPNTLGEQPLYEVKAIVTDPLGKQHKWERRIGLRALRLVRDKDSVGETFYFEVNGQPIFCKGANWVPVNVLLPEIKPENYRRLLQDAADSNMNMLRVWGGGIYENDYFYDCCDELGLLVWQDFMFACGSYPTWDPAFMENVSQEAADNIRRLRHHPSLALWSGNNEMEGAFAGQPDYPWDVYGKLFDELLPNLCADLDPATAYWPSSPHSPLGDRMSSESDLSGDTHHWSVFFGRKSFESQREWRTRFLSEFGFQSYPELRTIESFTEKADRSFMSRIMDYHQRSEVGNQTIFSYLLDWFQPNLDFETLLTLSQLTHSLCVRYAVEHLRRIQPLCGGVLYWQLNDVWPCASWSSIDSFGRWKALQYESRRFFAPVLVSIEEDLLKSKARIHLSNQRAVDAHVAVRWQITDTDGKVYLEEEITVLVPLQTGIYLADLDASVFLKTRHAHDLMIWAWASEAGVVVSRNWVPLARPKYLSLANPDLQVRVETSGDDVLIHLSGEKPAPYVMLALEKDDAVFEDNFLHLHPKETRTIKMVRGPAADQVEAQLKIRSLADWMEVRPASSSLEPKPKSYELQRKR